jgi:hypothetical protein
LVNLNLVVANAIKIKVNIVVLLLKSLLFELINVKIHVKCVVRLNAIEDNCKTDKTIHLHFFAIRSTPSVKPLNINRNTHKGSGGNKKLPPRRIPTVGIEQKVPSTQTQLSHKHHHHSGAVCPSYGVLTMDMLDWTRATPSEGVGQERFSLV